MKNQISVREAISAEETARFWRELGAYHDRDIFANAESEEREYFHGSEYREAVQAAHDRAADRCAELVKALNAKGYRAEADYRNEKIGKKIREATLEKIPYMLVVGDRDMEAGTVSVRTRKGEDLGAMSLDTFSAMLRRIVDEKQKI